MKLVHTYPLVAAAIAGLLLLPRAGAAPLAIPTSGSIWKDVTGNEINCHGGGILKVGDTYYWFGENRSEAGQGVGVNCYTSTNLVDWTFRNVVLSQNTPGLGDSRFERPKVIYNDKTKKYVLWVHRENLRDYGDAQAAVAQCDTPDGNYTLVKIFRPFDKTDVTDHNKPGYMSRDCNLYKDDDGTAWFISAANENYDMMLYKLSPDYLDTVEHYDVLPGAHREGPALFKMKGKYYLITSACTGWTANDNTIQVADKITGPYGPQQLLIAPTGEITFNSQSTFVLPVTGSKGTTYIFMADRWKPWNLPDSRNLWFPLRFDKGKFMPIAWGDHWQLDPATGLATFPVDPTPSKNDVALHKPVTCDIYNQVNGKEPSLAVDGNPRTGWAASDRSAPQWLKVDLGKPSEITESNITWEGDQRAYQYTIECSMDGKSWTKVADNRKNEIPSQTNDDKLKARGRYFRLTMTGEGAGPYFWATCMEWALLNGTENLALNKPVEASSAQWGKYSAKITDGDFATYWTPGDNQPGHWAQIDLGKSYSLTGCRIFWQSPGIYYQYRVDVSPDGKLWSEVLDETNQTTVERLEVHPFKATGRYVRLTLLGDDDGYWPSLAEMEVFSGGKPPAAEQYTAFRSSSGTSIQ